MENNEKYKDIKGSRLGSDIIDYLIHTTISEIIGGIVGIIIVAIMINRINLNMINDSLRFVGISSIAGSIISILVIFFYYTMIPYLTKGATIGKLALKLKIVNDDYSICSFKTLLKRNIRLYIEILSIIPALLSAADVMGLGTFIVCEFIIGLIKYALYIVIILQISRGVLPIHDSFASTMVVHKMYNPNVENYKTITEISSWADVVGIDSSIAANSNVTSNDEIKNDDENNFWGE